MNQPAENILCRYVDYYDIRLDPHPDENGILLYEPKPDPPQDFCPRAALIEETIVASFIKKYGRRCCNHGIPYGYPFLEYVEMHPILAYSEINKRIDSNERVFCRIYDKNNKYTKDTVTTYIHVAYYDSNDGLMLQISDEKTGFLHMAVVFIREEELLKPITHKGRSGKIYIETKGGLTIVID